MFLTIFGNAPKIDFYSIFEPYFSKLTNELKIEEKYSKTVLKKVLIEIDQDLIKSVLSQRQISNCL